MANEFMSEIALKANNLSKVFSVRQGPFQPKKKLRAVDDVSISIRRGEVLGIVGESGCGKSTLARMLLGLIRPTEGEIEISGGRLSEFKQREIAKLVQPIFQDPYSSLNPRKTVGSIISLPLRVHGNFSVREQRKKTEEIMELTGLPRRLHDNYPSQLSGGQRQRVAIARALIVRPSIIVCDEPTSALDVSIQAQILNLLQKLRKDFNLTYIIISHNLAVIEHIADNVAVMYLGKIVDAQSAGALFKQPRHPYTKALLNSVLTPEPDKNLPNYDLGLSYPSPLSPPPGCTFHPRCREVLEECKTKIPSAHTRDDGYVACHLFSQKQHATTN